MQRAAGECEVTRTGSETAPRSQKESFSLGVFSLSWKLPARCCYAAAALPPPSPTAMALRELAANDRRSSRLRDPTELSGPLPLLGKQKNCRDGR